MSSQRGCRFRANRRPTQVARPAARTGSGKKYLAHPRPAGDCVHHSIEQLARPHQVIAACRFLPTSSLRFKIAYLQQLNEMVPPFPAELHPEARWMVDPDDYLKPLVYDPKSPRWAKPKGRPGSVGQCG